MYKYVLPGLRETNEESSVYLCGVTERPKILDLGCPPLTQGPLHTWSVTPDRYLVRYV